MLLRQNSNQMKYKDISITAVHQLITDFIKPSSKIILAFLLDFKPNNRKNNKKTKHLCNKKRKNIMKTEVQKAFVLRDSLFGDLSSCWTSWEISEGESRPNLPFMGGVGQ